VPRAAGFSKLQSRTSWLRMLSGGETTPPQCVSHGGQMMWRKLSESTHACR
jgi:hypothetical protein